MPSLGPLLQTDLSKLVDATFLQGVTYFAETDSTNTQALARLSSAGNVATPHLVYAESQISGRGRGANQWWSSAGSLTFSVVVDCADLGLTLEQQPKLPLITGLAILRTGQSFTPRGDFALKWPNDVYLNGRKLAGILIEVPSQLSRRIVHVAEVDLNANQPPRYAVIGVGFNVNNQFVDAPAGLQNTGISMSEVSRKTHNRIEVLASFVRNLEALIQSLANGEPVLNDWPAFCLLTGKQVTLQTGSTEVTGICRGIDATGALLLETENGPQRYLGGVVKSWN